MIYFLLHFLTTLYLTTPPTKKPIIKPVKHKNIIRCIFLSNEISVLQLEKSALNTFKFCNSL